MRHYTSTAILFFCIILFSSMNAQNDNVPKPGWLVTSQNMVDLSDVGKMNKMIDSISVPIMQELIDEGKLIGWGQFNHAWGDKWNVNVYYITESHEAFLEFWKEFIARISKKHPNSNKDFIELINAHKDNMYSVRHMLMRTNVPK